MKLLIISHTEHYLNDNGKVIGWEPTVREINYLGQIFSKIYHIAPLHSNQKNKRSAISYEQNIELIPIKPSGGKGLDKFTILTTSFETLRKIGQYKSKVDYIHFRAPTGIGFTVLPYLKIFNNKKLWIKYAGNWMDSNMPSGNRFQKWWLNHMIAKTDVITVNGNWDSQNVNIKAFENPCILEKDRTLGALAVEKKDLSGKINFCFVGALNEHKGVHLILEALKGIKDTRLGEFHFVGGGNDFEKYKNISKGLEVKCVFHGFLPKDAIVDVYSKCHFIVLPSKNEGFPKVISEGMNYGCVPVVSDVSAISQYVKDKTNGLLISTPITVDELKGKIEEALSIADDSFITMMKDNYALAENFTFKKYLYRLSNEIFVVD
ncbi:MAG: capsular biosynthesis protein [Flavobacteriia bacterium]|nr:MAG: capsular biosynthesis protein [Flavobacteriia bacterium]